MFGSFAGPNDEAMGLPEQIVAAMQEERVSLMRTDAFRSLLFVVLTAALVWLFMKDKVRKGGLVAGLCVIVAADLFPVDKRYVSADFHPKRQALAIPMTEADKLILQDTTDYRVANFTLDPFTDATTSRYHRSVGGYHAAKLRRYQDLIDHHLRKENRAVYDMLNTKYFIVPGSDGRPAVQQNPYACGSAWFVDSVAWVENADQEIAALESDGRGGGFDPRTTAVVDRRFAPQLEGLDFAADSTASVVLTEYRVNRQTYRTRAARDGVAVLSEIYYPKGWTATIDGRPAEYFRADYVLRAIRVPAGETVNGAGANDDGGARRTQGGLFGGDGQRDAGAVAAGGGGLYPDQCLLFDLGGTERVALFGNAVGHGDAGSAFRDRETDGDASGYRDVALYLCGRCGEGFSGVYRDGFRGFPG